jgi:hypothetical protein
LGLLAAGGGASCGGDDDAAVGRDAGAREERDAGSGPPIAVTAGQAVAGVCLLKVANPDRLFAHCKGFAEYEACARRQCDLELCLDQCGQYVGCLQASPKVCDESCVPEDACSSCMSEVAQCALSSTCIGTFSCAERVEDGYCDQLRACCELQSDQLRDECKVLAEASAAIQGEQSCRTLLGTVPMLENGTAVECPIHDAGTPER